MEEDIVLSVVQNARKDFPRMGAKKLLIYLQPTFQAMGIHIGRDTFIELLYRNYLLVRRVRNKRKTTFSNHWMRKYPNLIRGYTPTAPNQLWVSDITYIEMAGRFAYLALVTDAYSHMIVGWELAPSLRACNALAALKMALNRLPEEYSGLIHHSDRGSQYFSFSYVNLLTQTKAQISLTECVDTLANQQTEKTMAVLIA